ncbi:MAG: hypothetical protein RIQ56_455 [Candidatus Parcubacteria bacterium]|jgi:hypothetical protein
MISGEGLGFKPKIRYYPEMHSIRDWWQEIKLHLEVGVQEWGIVALIILTGVLSFGLGRLSVNESTNSVIAVTNVVATSSQRSLPLGGAFVASRSGSVYYFPWCTGAQKIPQQLQLWFSTEEAAQKAGFRAAKNCKGL